MKVQILKYPHDWRCDAGHGFDKPGGSGTTGRRYFKDDDGSYWHEVLLRRYKGGHAMSTTPKTYTREFIGDDGTKTLQLLDADHNRPRNQDRTRGWSHETHEGVVVT